MPRQRGGNFPVFQGYAVQRGRGFGSLLGGLLKSIIPMARSAIVPAAKSVGKSLVRHGARHAAKALKSVSRGESLKSAVKKQVASAIADATQKSIKEVQRIASRETPSTNQRAGKRRRGPPGKRVKSSKAKRARLINEAFTG